MNSPNQSSRFGINQWDNSNSTPTNRGATGPLSPRPSSQLSLRRPPSSHDSQVSQLMSPRQEHRSRRAVDQSSTSVSSAPRRPPSSTQHSSTYETPSLMSPRRGMTTPITNHVPSTPSSRGGATLTSAQRPLARQVPPPRPSITNRGHPPGTNRTSSGPSRRPGSGVASNNPPLSMLSPSLHSSTRSTSTSSSSTPMSPTMQFGRARHPSTHGSSRVAQTHQQRSQSQSQQGVDGVDLDQSYLSPTLDSSTVASSSRPRKPPAAPRIGQTAPPSGRPTSRTSAEDIMSSPPLSSSLQTTAGPRTIRGGRRPQVDGHHTSTSSRLSIEALGSDDLQDGRDHQQHPREQAMRRQSRQRSLYLAGLASPTMSEISSIPQAYNHDLYDQLRTAAGSIGSSTASIGHRTTLDISTQSGHQQYQSSHRRSSLSLVTPSEIGPSPTHTLSPSFQQGTRQRRGARHSFLTQARLGIESLEREILTTFQDHGSSGISQTSEGHDHDHQGQRNQHQVTHQQQSQKNSQQDYNPSNISTPHSVLMSRTHQSATPPNELNQTTISYNFLRRQEQTDNERVQSHQRLQQRLKQQQREENVQRSTQNRSAIYSKKRLSSETSADEYFTHINPHLSPTASLQADFSPHGQYHPSYSQTHTHHQDQLSHNHGSRHDDNGHDGHTNADGDTDDGEDDNTFFNLTHTYIGSESLHSDSSSSSYPSSSSSPYQSSPYEPRQFMLRSGSQMSSSSSSSVSSTAALRGTRGRRGQTPAASLQSSSVSSSIPLSTSVSSHPSRRRGRNEAQELNNDDQPQHPSSSSGRGSHTPAGSAVTRVHTREMSAIPMNGDQFDHSHNHSQSTNTFPLSAHPQNTPQAQPTSFVAENDPTTVVDLETYPLGTPTMKQFLHDLWLHSFHLSDRFLVDGATHTSLLLNQLMGKVGVFAMPLRPTLMPVEQLAVSLFQQRQYSRVIWNIETDCGTRTAHIAGDFHQTGEYLCTCSAGDNHIPTLTNGLTLDQVSTYHQYQNSLHEQDMGEATTLPQSSPPSDVSSLYTSCHALYMYIYTQFTLQSERTKMKSIENGTKLEDLRKRERQLIASNDIMKLLNYFTTAHSFLFQYIDAHVHDKGQVENQLPLHPRSKLQTVGEHTSEYPPLPHEVYNTHRSKHRNGFVSSTKRVTTSTSSASLFEQLRSSSERSYHHLCPYLLYLHALLLSHISIAPPHRHIQLLLIVALHLAPCQWSAWTLLAETITSTTDLYSLSLPRHIMSRIFFAKMIASLPTCDPEQIRTLLPSLNKVIPDTTTYHSIVLAASITLRHQPFEDTNAPRAYQQLLEFDPYNRDLVVEISDVYKSLDTPIDLEPLARLLTREAPTSPSTHLVLANYFEVTKQHDRALIHLRQALLLNTSPKFTAKIWVRIGLIYLSKRHTINANSAFLKATEYDPNLVSAYFYLGMCELVMERYTLAVHYFSICTGKSKGNVGYWESLGDAYKAIGSLLQALNAYRAAVRLAIEQNTPHRLASVACKTALLLKEFGDEEAAADYYSLVLEHKRTRFTDVDASAVLFIAHVRLRQNRKTEARNYVEQLIQRGLYLTQAQEILRHINA